MIFFACLEMRSMPKICFKYLNSNHSNIKFTMEKETSKFLPFLDVLVKNEGRIFTTSVYRKKMALGLNINAI